jgi:hypothetical protein
MLSARSSFFVINFSGYTSSITRRGYYETAHRD